VHTTNHYIKLMKLLFCLLLSLSVSPGLHSQHCETLEKALFFTSIQLGGQVPKDVTNCQKNVKFEYPAYTDYRLKFDSLNQVCKKKYADLFKFKSVPFSNSIISTNKKGQIFLAEMFYFFEDCHGRDSIHASPPANFVKLFNQFVSLYGNPTRIEKSPDSDTLFIKDLGIHQSAVWECNNLYLQLRVNYGSRTKSLNIVEVQIKNAQFELMENIEALE
jgi:hypothetical protein